MDCIISLLDNNAKYLGKELGDIYDKYRIYPVTQKPFEETAWQAAATFLNSEVSKLYTERHFPRRQRKRRRRRQAPWWKPMRSA